MWDSIKLKKVFKTATNSKFSQVRYFTQVRSFKKWNSIRMWMTQSLSHIIELGMIL